MAFTAQRFLPPWFLLLAITSLSQCSDGARTLTALVEQPTYPMTYHNGALLTGPITVKLIFYGRFTPAQRAIISDFVSSLSSPAGAAAEEPSVSTWWKTLQKYYVQSNKPFPVVRLGSQILDESYSLGKSLQNDDLVKLGARGGAGAVNVVLTAADVTVDGFCMSRCGTHGASVAPSPSKTKKAVAAGGGRRFTYIWVGNSETQCPGQCAWPFSKPIYGPQMPALVAPNGDVGADGMVINFASMLAGTLTDPYVDGFFQGPKEAPLEAATACPGAYGKGWYAGYPGVLLEDKATKASYNAHGAHGRKYLIPALFDPSTSTCVTLV